ncbi:hypothetical protein R1flu_009820 [Riccia fluitans]|uniref:BRCT domain-containing protein n=1 Tax=Riccia fluitans TaxID=41844 RepID=A0ABD1Z3C0_9MARC
MAKPIFVDISDVFLDGGMSLTRQKLLKDKFLQKGGDAVNSLSENPIVVVVATMKQVEQAFSSKSRELKRLKLQNKVVSYEWIYESLKRGYRMEEKMFTFERIKVEVERQKVIDAELEEIRRSKLVKEALKAIVNWTPPRTPLLH